MVDNKNESRLAALSERERIAEFKEWFLNTASKVDGGRYGENTYGAYFTALNTFSKQLKERGLYKLGVFEIFQEDKIGSLIEILDNNPKLQVFLKARKEYYNVANGLAQYKKFLLSEAGVLSEAISAEDVNAADMREFKEFLDEKHPTLAVDWSGKKTNTLQSVSPADRKEAFERWLSSQFINGKDGRKYEVTTARNYSANTNRFFGDFTGDGILPNIFEYSTAEEFSWACEAIFDLIKQRYNGKHEKYNSETKNGIKKYSEFLRENAGGFKLGEPKNNGQENLKRAITLLDMAGENIIFYGVPGSGKSYSIRDRVGEIVRGKKTDKDDAKRIYEDLAKTNNIWKVVFHPDYTYSDFTGQILPVLEGHNVKYEFKPGPFTSILKLAINRPFEPFFLIIEEINRGNSAAIFGDVFQLLDRIDEGDNKGRSEYTIKNSEIALEIYRKNDEDIKDEDIKNKDRDIYIPNNLWLFATMNTSDQNVFTLDTAFQRRWEMEMIRNVFKEQSTDKINHDFEIEGTGITWRQFADGVVNKRLEGEAGVMSSEDKRLGAWFVKPDLEGAVSKRRFANKVLKYLWDDAFKFNRGDFFNVEKYKTLEQIIDAFEAMKSGGFGDLLGANIVFAHKETSAEGQ